MRTRTFAIFAIMLGTVATVAIAVFSGVIVSRADDTDTVELTQVQYGDSVCSFVGRISRTSTNYTAQEAFENIVVTIDGQELNAPYNNFGDGSLSADGYFTRQKYKAGKQSFDVKIKYWNGYYNPYAYVDNDIWSNGSAITATNVVSTDAEVSFTVELYNAQYPDGSIFLQEEQMTYISVFWVSMMMNVYVDYQEGRTPIYSEAGNERYLINFQFYAYGWSSQTEWTDQYGNPQVGYVDPYNNPNIASALTLDTSSRIENKYIGTSVISLTMRSDSASGYVTVHLPYGYRFYYEGFDAVSDWLGLTTSGIHNPYCMKSATVTNYGATSITFSYEIDTFYYYDSASLDTGVVVIYDLDAWTDPDPSCQCSCYSCMKRI